MTDPIQFQRVADRLPDDLRPLRQQAEREGYRFLTRLEQGWASGDNRFDHPGEALLIARNTAGLVGIGGITRDPRDPTALRMRRFYVSPSFRGQGIARLCAERLIAGVPPSCPCITVNAGTDAAAAFWERLGFRPVTAPHHTHILQHDHRGNRMES